MCPATRASELGVADLPDVMTADELARFERVAVQTIRKDLEAGKIAGAYRRGRAWRISKRAYLDSVQSHSPSEGGAGDGEQ